MSSFHQTPGGKCKLAVHSALVDANLASILLHSTARSLHTSNNVPMLRVGADQHGLKVATLKKALSGDAPHWDSLRQLWVLLPALGSLDVEDAKAQGVSLLLEHLLPEDLFWLKERGMIDSVDFPQTTVKAAQWLSKMLDSCRRAPTLEACELAMNAGDAKEAASILAKRHECGLPSPLKDIFRSARAVESASQAENETVHRDLAKDLAEAAEVSAGELKTLLLQVNISTSEALIQAVRPTSRWRFSFSRAGLQGLGVTSGVAQDCRGWAGLQGLGRSEGVGQNCLVGHGPPVTLCHTGGDRASRHRAYTHRAKCGAAEGAWWWWGVHLLLGGSASARI